jgi:hypothetical protein
MLVLTLVWGGLNWSHQLVLTLIFVRGCKHYLSLDAYIHRCQIYCPLSEGCWMTATRSVDFCRRFLHWPLSETLISFRGCWYWQLSGHWPLSEVADIYHCLRPDFCHKLLMLTALRDIDLCQRLQTLTAVRGCWHWPLSEAAVGKCCWHWSLSETLTSVKVCDSARNIGLCCKHWSLSATPTSIRSCYWFWRWLLDCNLCQRLQL